MSDDNEETQVPETQIEEDNNPTPNENDSNPAVTENNDTEATISTQAAMNKRKGRSPAWEHFEKKEIRGQIKAVCIHCKNILGASSKNETRYLLDHVKSCLYKRQRTIDQSMLNPTKLSDGSVKLGTYNFDHDHARKALANMIILHEYPLSMVDHIGFKMYSNALQPLFKVCSRNTIKKDIFKVFEVEREKTMKLLDTNRSRIAITTDMWTSNNQKRGFMTITSHFIDDAWHLQSRLIRFIYVPCPHTAEVLADALLECMFEWNLDRKLSTLTVDNCSTNDSMIAIVLDKICSSSLMLDGRLFHMRCCAHILNLVVRDGLDVIKKSIEKIRYSVAFWLGTQKREEKFLEAARQLRVPTSKMLELDCKTRWNSTYSMLKTAMIYKDVFPRLKHREPLYKEVPSESDWAKTKELVDKLAMFYDVTVLFSGTKYPTANLYFKNICAIRLAIYDWLSSEQEEVQAMALHMQTKFEKYWDTMHGLMGVASILDPRYKMKQIEFLCPLIYSNNAAQEIKKYKDILYDLVKEYQSRSQQSQQVQSEFLIPTSSSRPSMPKLDLVKQLDVFVSHSTTHGHVKSELDHYLEESLLPRNDDDDFDILCWWKSNGIKYPTLHDIARDILAIHVSTVASESCFSTSGRIISPHRSQLHSNTVEALMCAYDWLWSEIRASSPNENEARRVTIQDEEVDNNEEEESTIETENISLFFD
ncbi:hypothetical protein L3X38_003737 [Prunus dulcis]|uniref:BED zinc finger n=1 Tax=Prunus dulcis TaxID=3755 RepID=A0AAD4ZMN2_PRUDU|nr:hypothetical protein L3X38_003737 [Prunus dulcis]